MGARNADDSSDTQCRRSRERAGAMGIAAGVARLSRQVRGWDPRARPVRRCKTNAGAADRIAKRGKLECRHMDAARDEEECRGLDWVRDHVRAPGNHDAKRLRRWRLRARIGHMEGQGPDLQVAQGNEGLREGDQEGRAAPVCAELVRGRPPSPASNTSRTRSFLAGVEVSLRRGGRQRARRDRPLRGRGAPSGAASRPSTFPLCEHLALLPWPPSTSHAWPSPC